MVSFTKTDIKYRDFSLLVNIPKTAFGFDKGNLVIFRNYSPGDAIPDKMNLAISQPMSQQLEIGQ